MTQLFVEHKICKVRGDGVQIYTCQEKRGRNLFAVQLSTFTREEDGAEGKKQHDYCQGDMLVSFMTNPDIDWFPTLEEAISAHDEDFS